MGKHKKSKSEKDEKKSKKKSSKKHSKDKHGSGERGVQNPREGNSLLEVVAEAVASYPLLLDELPPMIASLDRGATENLASVTDAGKRQALNRIMEKLQVVEKAPGDGGWRRSSANIKVHKILASDFLSQDLQSLVKRTRQNLAPGVAVALILFFPNIVLEFPALLHQLLDDQAVQLDGMENASLRQGLAAFLQTLGCEKHTEGFSRTSSRPIKGMLDVLKCYCKSGGRHELSLSSGKSHKQSEEQEHQRRRKEADDECRRPSSPAPSSHSSSPSSPSSSSASEDEAAPHDASLPPTTAQEEPLRPSAASSAVGARVVGPQLPSRSSHPPDGSDSEEDVGPQPAVAGWVGPVNANQAVGLLGVTLFNEGESATEEAASSAPKREEWILDPGQSKALKALGGGEHGLFNVPRKFQTGKQAKKKAEDVSIRQEYLRKVAAEREATGEGAVDPPSGGGASHSALPDVDKAPSLLEEHLQKRARKDVGPSAHPQERRPFDRERDVLSRRQLTQEDVVRLADNARELDTRFDRAAVQRNFL